MTFKVLYEPDETGWHASVPAVPGCRTWGRSLSAARRAVREALSTCVDVLGKDAGRLARDAPLVEEFRLPPAVSRSVEDYRAARLASERMSAALQSAVREAAVALTQGGGVSLRDAGELLGLSHERVNQVLHSKAAREHARRSRATAARGR